MKTFILSLVFALGAMFTGLALATQPGNNGGGNGGCGVGQQTNGCGGSGGAGGAGGTGTGVGVGVGIANAAASANAAAVSGSVSGAAVVGSGNSSVRNANTQGQSQSSRNTATTGAVTNGASTGPVTVSVEGAKGDVVYAPAQERPPVATAYAAPLTASNGTCMGSSSAGGQGAAIGITIGTTWTDTNCDIRYDAEALRAAGLNAAAQARLCQKKEIKDAMESAGLKCPNKAAESRAEIYGPTSAPVATAAPQAQYQDPIIRARLGLPPLK